MTPSVPSTRDPTKADVRRLCDATLAVAKRLLEIDAATTEGRAEAALLVVKMTAIQQEIRTLLGKQL